MRGIMKRIDRDLENEIKRIREFIIENGVTDSNGKEPSFVKTSAAVAAFLREQDENLKEDLSPFAKYFT